MVCGIEGHRLPVRQPIRLEIIVEKKPTYSILGCNLIIIASQYFVQECVCCLCINYYEMKNVSPENTDYHRCLVDNSWVISGCCPRMCINSWSLRRAWCVQYEHGNFLILWHSCRWCRMSVFLCWYTRKQRLHVKAFAVCIDPAMWISSN